MLNFSNQALIGIGLPITEEPSPHHPAYGAPTKAVRLELIEAVVGSPTDFMRVFRRHFYIKWIFVFSGWESVWVQ